MNGLYDPLEFYPTKGTHEFTYMPGSKRFTKTYVTHIDKFRGTHGINHFVSYQGQKNRSAGGFTMQNGKCTYDFKLPKGSIGRKVAERIPRGGSVLRVVGEATDDGFEVPVGSTLGAGPEKGKQLPLGISDETPTESIPVSGTRDIENNVPNKTESDLMMNYGPQSNINPASQSDAATSTFTPNLTMNYGLQSSIFPPSPADAYTNTSGPNLSMSRGPTASIAPYVPESEDAPMEDLTNNIRVIEHTPIPLQLEFTSELERFLINGDRNRLEEFIQHPDYQAWVNMFTARFEDILTQQGFVPMSSIEEIFNQYHNYISATGGGRDPSMALRALVIALAMTTANHRNQYRSNNTQSSSLAISPATSSGSVDDTSTGGRPKRIRRRSSTDVTGARSRDMVVSTTIAPRESVAVVRQNADNEIVRSRAPRRRRRDENTPASSTRSRI